MYESLEVNALNLHLFSTKELQLIAIEQIARLTDRSNPGNAGLANDCLAEIVARESVAWEKGHMGPNSLRVVA